MKLFSRAAALTIALLFAASASAPTAPVVPAVPAETVPQTLTVMALGDSITAGVGAEGAPQSGGGYRETLLRLLSQGGYHAVMVGERSDYSAGVASPAHEGWPGYVLRSLPSDPAGQLFGEITRAAVEGYHPDVILLMAGTNDLLRYARGSAGYTLPEIRESLDLEIGEIFAVEPSVRLVVAGVVDSPRVPHEAVTAFSSDVAGLVAEYRARGFRIEDADGMSDSVPRDRAHFPDGIHPSGGDGYAMIAATWYRAIGETLATWPAVPGEAAKPTVAKDAGSHPQR